MLLPPTTRFYLATAPIDGRKSFYTLSAVVKNVLEKEPLKGGVFIFTNKKRDLLKILYWDDNGFALWQKHLAKGKFVTARCTPTTSHSLDLTVCQLQGLIAGIDWRDIDKPRVLQYTLT